MRIQMRKISENQEILMLLLGEALFGREAKLPTEVDWRGVFKEAKQQSVLPLAFEAARPRLTEELAAEYSERVDKLVVNNMYMEFDHVELHACMSEAEIPYVVMKGSASAAYYPRPLLRMMGDVDFLVSREDAARAGEALKRMGFRETAERDNPIHQAYRRDDGMTHVSEWELHWSPNGIPRNESGEKIRALLADYHAGACAVNKDVHLFLTSLYLDGGYARLIEFFLDEVSDLVVLNQKVTDEFVLGKPAGVPPFDNAHSETVGIYFLAHNLPPDLILSRRGPT